VQQQRVRERADSDIQLEELQEELSNEMRHLKATSPRRQRQAPTSPKSPKSPASTAKYTPKISSERKEAPQQEGAQLQSQIDSNRKMYTILKRAKLRQSS